MSKAGFIRTLLLTVDRSSDPRVTIILRYFMYPHTRNKNVAQSQNTYFILRPNLEFVGEQLVL